MNGVVGFCKSNVTTNAEVDLRFTEGKRFWPKVLENLVTQVVKGLMVMSIKALHAKVNAQANVIVTESKYQTNHKQ